MALRLWARPRARHAAVLPSLAARATLLTSSSSSLSSSSSSLSSSFVLRVRGVASSAAVSVEASPVARVGSVGPLRVSTPRALAAAPGSSEAAGVSELDASLHNLEARVDAFEEEFADAPAEGPLVAWMHHFYAFPRPDLLVPAFAYLLESPTGFTGRSQLPLALFFGRALRQAGPQAHLVLRSFAELIERAADASPEQATVERREGLLFVMLHSRLPQAEAGVAAILDNMIEAVELGGADALAGVAPLPEELRSPAAFEHGLQEFRQRLRAILPAKEGDRFPMHSVDWPCPALPEDEDTFFRGAKSLPNPPWARSGYHLSLALLTHQRARLDTTSARSSASSSSSSTPTAPTPTTPMTEADWSHLGELVGQDVIDCLWYDFFATGNPLSVQKAVQAAASWTEFASEAPETHLLQPALQPVPDAFSLEHDPTQRHHMRFVLARHAAHCLVRHCSQHSLVLEVVERTRDELANWNAHDGGRPPSRRGRQVLEFIDLVRPLIHAIFADGRKLAERALEDARATQRAKLASEGTTGGAGASSLRPDQIDVAAGATLPTAFLAMLAPLPPMVLQAWGRDGLGGGIEAARESLNRSKIGDLSGLAVAQASLDDATDAARGVSATAQPGTVDDSATSSSLWSELRADPAGMEDIDPLKPTAAASRTQRDAATER